MFDKKILCIGNEIEHTDIEVSLLAKKHTTINHGIITSADFVPKLFGYYHTSIADIPAGAIAQNLVQHFDSICMLDQSAESYPHFKSFVNTFRLMIELEKNNIPTDFRNNQNNKNILYWHTLLKTNKSLCVYPFINFINVFGQLSMCQKNSRPISTTDAVLNWSTDPAWSTIRNNMLSGQQMPDKCSICYDRENLGQASARQFESLDWAMHLGLEDEKELAKIKYPVYYEIRVSNKCNIMCRMCDDQHSHLIANEYKKIGFSPTHSKVKMQGFPFEKIDFSTAKQIHWTGGDPTVQSEFYEFLRQCIRQNNTGFYLTIGTNGLKISNTLLDLLTYFPKVSFSVSIDGFQKVNDYIRWGTVFDQIKNNCYNILKRGHKLAFQTVFTMYNATRIHEVYEFYDRDFPGCNTLVQAGYLEPFAAIDPWHHPLKEKVLESMYRCRETQVYYNAGRNTNDLVDEMISRYENYEYSPEYVRQFFEYNDKLDQSRNSRLEDYIPELAAARQKLD